jgi:hypothetical protein
MPTFNTNNKAPNPMSFKSGFLEKLQNKKW